MTIPYSLDENRLTDKGGYFARMKSSGTADLEMIIDRMVERGSTLGKADALAAMQLLIEVIIALILDGWRVSLGGLVRLYCTIEGTFDSYSDSFHPSRHTLKGSAQSGRLLDKALRYRGKPRKRQSETPVPNPTRFTDVVSGAYDSFTPGGMGRLEGWRLKTNPDADDEGVFLIGQDGQEHRLKVVYNTAKLLIVSLPNLPPGAYYLEVRARVGNAKTVRISRLPQPLSAIESAT